jgi:Xaa-Pro dipeptidase
MANLHKDRRARLAAIAAERGLGAVAVVPVANFAYLTGLQFHLMERPTVLFITAGGQVLGIIPELEREKWAATLPAALTFYWQDSDGYDAAFASAVAALEGAVIGVEGMRMRVFEADALRRHAPQGAVVDAEQWLAGLRLSKSAAEIACLQSAIDISELALAETVAGVRGGMTERQIQALLKMRMLAGGAEGFAFEPLVLIGANAANPHGVTGDRVLGPGDALLVDFGASVAGYHADITRTFFCGHVTDDHADLYHTVLAANAQGRAMAGPDMSAHDLDTAVTAVLAASRFAGLIVHKTGHGLGLDVHEAPQIMKGNHSPLIPGAVFTIEPGLYRPTEIGVRIEDNVVITDNGAQCLTRYPRELTLINPSHPE